MSLSVLLFPGLDNMSETNSVWRYPARACFARRRYVKTVMLPEQIPLAAELLHHAADRHQLVAYASFVQKSLDDTQPEQRQRFVIPAVRRVPSADTFIVKLDARSHSPDCDIFWESHQVPCPHREVSTVGPDRLRQRAKLKLIDEFREGWLAVQEILGHIGA